MRWPAPCWDPSDATAMISFEAGSPADAGDHDRGDHVFEAIHTPPHVREVSAPEFREDGEGRGGTQEHVLNALDDMKPFLFITGVPGTGKSHLVRWLHLNRHVDAEDPREIRAYVPRSMTRLRDVLRTVLEYAEPSVREQLERDLDTATTGLDERTARGQLLANIAQVIESRAPTIKAGNDPAFQLNDHVAVVDDLHELLRARPVREYLCRDGGSLSRMVTTRVTGQRSAGMSADEELRIQHEELLGLAAIKTGGIAKEADRLLSKISSDPGVRKATHQLLGPVHSDPALQRLVGLSVGQMEEAMKDLLASLDREARRLILFFEDWGLISGLQEEIAEAIASAASGSVLAVVAITTDRLHEQRNNVLERGRIFVLDPPSSSVPGAELARAHPGADVLAAHALNAVRLGRDNLEMAYAGRQDRAGWHGSRCGTCPFDAKDACHSSFGSIYVDGIGDVGLFPFSRESLGNALTRKSGGEPAVPRVVLHEVLRRGLDEEFARQLERNEFPSSEFAEEFRRPGLQLSDVQEATLKDRLRETESSHEFVRTKAFLETFRRGIDLDSFDDAQRIALGLPELGAVPDDDDRGGDEDDSGEKKRAPVEVPPLAQEAFQWRRGGAVTAERNLKELAAREVLAALPVHRPIWRRSEWSRAGLDYTHVAFGDDGKYSARGPELRIPQEEAEALAYLAWSFERSGSWREIEAVPVARAFSDGALERWVENVSSQLFDDESTREAVVEALIRVLAVSGIAGGAAPSLDGDNVLDVVFSRSDDPVGDELARIGTGGNARSDTLDVLLRYVSFGQGTSAALAIDYDFVAPIATRVAANPLLPAIDSLPEDVPEWAKSLPERLETAVDEQYSRAHDWWRDYGSHFRDRGALIDLMGALKTLTAQAISVTDPRTHSPILRTNEKELVRRVEVSIDRLNVSLDDPDVDVFQLLLVSKERLERDGLVLVDRITVARELQELESFRSQLASLYNATLELLGTIESRLPDDDAGTSLDTTRLDDALGLAGSAVQQLGGR